MRGVETLPLRGAELLLRETVLRLLLLLRGADETLREGALLRLDETLLLRLLLGALLRLTDAPERDELLLPAGRCANSGMQARAKTTRNAIIFLLLFMVFSFLKFVCAVFIG